MDEKNYKEIRIKQNIINCKNKYDFIYFVQDESDDDVLSLLDQEGIELLSKSENLSSYLNAIISSCRSYNTVLFQNNLFCDLFLNYFIKKDFDVTYCLSNDAAINLIIYCLKNKDRKIALDIFLRLGQDTKLYILKTELFTEEEIKKVIANLPKSSLDYIFKNSRNENLLTDISIEEFKIICEEKPCFYNKLNRLLIHKLIRTLDAETYRHIINNISVNNNSLEIEELRETFCNQLLNLVEKKEIIPDFKFIIEDVVNNRYLDFNVIKKNNLFMSQEYYYNLMTKNIFLIDKTEVEIKNYFQKLSEEILTDFIIDYHFEDYYDNVSIDINNILNYNKHKGGAFLNNEETNFYNLILNIHEMSFNKKLRLHCYMKKIKVQENFYDVVRKCKNDSYQMLRNNIISQECNNKNFINNELSIKNGIETHLLEGQPFYALVKCLNERTENILSNQFSQTDSKKGCYSVISHDDISTFYDPNKNYTIVYTDFNPEYILHTYPNDSFSLYSYKYDSSDSLLSSYSNEIHTPESLVKSGDGYNEILILNNAYNEEIILNNPKPGFILCYDKISENQIISAKKHNLKILLVNTNCYKKNLFESAGSILSKDAFKYKK